MTANQSGLSRRLLVLSFVALVGLVSAVVGWRWWSDECGDAPSGVRLNSNTHAECIGVTDGSYAFNDPLKATSDENRQIMERINDLQRRIAGENRNAAESSRYVKMVLLMPLTVSRSQSSAISLNQILYSLQGAYAALYRANHSGDFGDASALKVQLLLANQGSRQEAAPEFLDSILSKSEADHPVDAVVGLGSSIPNTEKAVDYLGKRGIPMVSAIASADSLSTKPLLWSVSPSNEQYASRLRSLLDGQHALRSGVIVYDRNPDLYTQSLRIAYHNELEPYLKFTNDQAFRGSTLDQPTITPNVFAPVVANLCSAAANQEHPLDMVLYAGRVADFSVFADGLKSRICAGQPLTILIGETGYAPTADLTKTLKSGNVKLIVAASSNSSVWAENKSDAPVGYTRFVDAYRAKGFAEAELSDGYAIAHHDAVVTAVRAIRLAGEGEATRAPNPDDVATQFAQLNLAHRVEAASGTLSFPAEGGRASGLSIPLEYFE